jgi:hypothetical protein
MKATSMPFDNAPFPDSYYAASATPMVPFPRLDGSISTDICIIGGGLTGLNTAIEWPSAGCRWWCWNSTALAGAPQGGMAGR